MDKAMKKELNKRLTVQMLATFVAAVLMLICVFLPYATANEEHRQQLQKYPDAVLVEKLDITAEEMVDISMAEYAELYYNLKEQFGDPAQGIFLAVLVALIGGFSLIAALFALGRKPIGVIIFTAMAYGVFYLQNLDYTQRGVVPGANYDWGVAHKLFPVFAIAAIAGAVWLLTRKIVVRKELKEELTEE